MPFVEPRINQFDITPPHVVLPNPSVVKREEVLALCKVWDARGLLKIFPASCGPKQEWGFCKVFNNFKNQLSDRQIGDRRGLNFVEGRLQGPSKYLPNATVLLQLAPERYKEMLSAAITDRRDFYHQFQITDEKACGNALYPLFDAGELQHLDAFGKYQTFSYVGFLVGRAVRLLGMACGGISALFFLRRMRR